MTASELTATIRRASLALEGGDAIAAESLLESAVSACEESLRTGLRFEASDLSELCGAHANCTAAAARCRARLTQAFGAAGSARRAVSAYQPQLRSR